MDSKERNYIAYGLIDEVLRKGAYSTLELSKRIMMLPTEHDRAFVTRLFYGVLSKNITLEYILQKLANKPPKKSVATIFKMGAYMLLYMSEPDYAVTDGMVDLTKRIGKKEVSGFINALLRKVKSVEFPIDSGNVSQDYSVNYSCPKWIVEMIIRDYGKDFAKKFLSYTSNEKTHIRANLSQISTEELAQKLQGVERTKSGFYLTANEMQSLNKNEYFIQSLSSCIATEYYAHGVNENSNVLDLCSAPGGKAVYLAQLTSANITACDIHPHRVDLINNYAKIAGVNITVRTNDATKFNLDFEQKFDTVICDVPCSGLGVMFSKPDILINKTQDDIVSLTKLQKQILATAQRYVKSKGVLCYSTCTITKAENEEIIDDFLQEHTNFEIEKCTQKYENGYVKLFPHTDNSDGFFVVRLRRKD